MFYLVISALIISGGTSSASNFVEVYIPSTGQHCQLPDLPGEKRTIHTMEKMTVCGGLYTKKSCISLIDGAWQTTTTLLEER